MTTVTTRKAKALNSNVLPNLSEADSVKVKSFAVNNTAPVSLLPGPVAAAAEAGILNASTNGQALTLTAANAVAGVTRFKGAAAAPGDILQFFVVHPNGGTLDVLGLTVPDAAVALVTIRLLIVTSGSEAYDTNVNF